MPAFWHVGIKIDLAIAMLLTVPFFAVAINDFLMHDSFKLFTIYIVRIILQISLSYQSISESSDTDDAMQLANEQIDKTNM